MTIVEALADKLKSAGYTGITLPESLPVGYNTLTLKHSAGETPFFLKRLKAEYLPQLHAEADGFTRIGETGAFEVPKIIAVVADAQWAYLLREYIVIGRKPNNYDENLGVNLALMHKHSAEKFGLPQDNFIGPLPQANGPLTDGREFFWQRRIMPQVEVAMQQALLHSGLRDYLETLHKRLPELLPAEPPAFVHGDLWNANVLVGPKGQPILIDPAVHYGLRETDLAMMHLFGGFEPEVFEAYRTAFPLLPGFMERLPLHQLYYLLVHVNLFGRSYVPQVEAVLKKYQ